MRGAKSGGKAGVYGAFTDINNDGIVDQVIRTKWTFRGVLNDALNVLPMNMQKVVIDGMLAADKKVMFNNGNYWLDRHKKKYGLGSDDWWFDGVASLNLFQQKGEVFVVAQNYAAPRNASSKIYIFKLDKNYEPNDVCILVRICPCGGCMRTSFNQSVKTFPAKKWCQK